MALINMNRMLSRAKEDRYAVPNFDISSDILLRGVCEAASRENSPVILAWADVFEPVVPIETFSAMLRAEAEQIGVPVCVHLDHARSLESIERALNCGFTSAMFDGSDLPLDENIRISAQAADMCHAKGATCEAELGHVGGLDGYSYEGDIYTKVSEAVRFAAETGVDALAVSIGTVHGVYKEEPKLNLDRLRELSEAVDVPLVLHGGSGLSDQDFRDVIDLGITKINLYTEATQAALNVLQNGPGEGYLGRCAMAVVAVAELAVARMKLFGSARKGL